jgi:large subunit ribosomal protein L4
MQHDVVDRQLKKVGSVELPEHIYGVTPNLALLWEQCRAQRASARAGTHATKTRGMVSGGGAKPHKQKGTGRARQGSSRAPNHVGGGVVFGPQPRSYAYRLPRSSRKAAMRSALSLRASEKKLLILKDFSLERPTTKAVVEFFGKATAKSLLMVDVDNGALLLSTRNVPKARYLTATAINVFDIVKYETLVITEAALQQIEQRASTEPQSPSEAAA